MGWPCRPRKSAFDVGISLIRTDLGTTLFTQRYQNTSDQDASVSVIIPTYNRAALLPETIACALAQTHPPLEVLVCDDGSTDDSEAVVAAIGDERVRWVPGPPSGGPAAPRNRGIQHAQGEWLGFCDSDDRWLPDKLRLQLLLASSSGLRAVSGNALRVSVGNAERPPFFESMPSRLTFEMQLKSNSVIGCTALIHSEIFNRTRSLHGGEGLQFPEKEGMGSYADYACWLRISTLTDWAVVPDHIALYRDEPQLSMRRDDLGDWAIRRMVFGDFIKWASINAPTHAVKAELELKHERKRRGIHNARIFRHRIKKMVLTGRIGWLWRKSTDFV